MTSDQINEKAYDEALLAFKKVSDLHPGQAVALKDAVMAYANHLAVAHPVVTNESDIYDMGSPEPEGVNYVVECDTDGSIADYLCSSAMSGNWAKKSDGMWQGYRDGEVYLSWDELMRRVGPVKRLEDEHDPSYI